MRNQEGGYGRELTRIHLLLDLLLALAKEEELEAKKNVSLGLDVSTASNVTGRPED